MISVVIGGHFGGGDHFDGGDHFSGGTAPPPPLSVPLLRACFSRNNKEIAVTNKVNQCRFFLQNVLFYQAFYRNL